MTVSFRFIIIFAILPLFIGLTSCSKDDDNDKSTNTHNYFPLKIGNYWIYNCYNTDSLGNKTGEPFIDSVVVKEALQFEGKSCFMLLSFKSNSSKIDTAYWRQSSNQVFCFANSSSWYLPNDCVINHSLNQWALVADNDKTSWNLTDEISKNYSLKYDLQWTNIDTAVDLRLLTNCVYSKEDTISAIPSKEYDILISAMSSNFAKDTISSANFSIVAKNKEWFAENIGLVKIERTPIVSSFNYTIAANSYKISNSQPRTIEILSSYKVN